MDLMGNDVVSVLSFLLPGFIAAWVFHGLTPFPKPKQFERVVQALILTLFVQAGVSVLATAAVALGKLLPLGQWSEQTKLIWSVVLALILGLLLARWATHDTIHARLRKWNFTSLTSYPSEWFSEFSRNQGYVVLHLVGERRLYGWPELWPSTPRDGQFSIAEAEWLVDGDRRPLTGVRNVVVPAQDVELVEFMELAEVGQGTEPSNGKSEA